MKANPTRCAELDLLQNTPSPAVFVLAIGLLAVAALPLLVLTMAWSGVVNASGGLVAPKVPFPLWFPMVAPLLCALVPIAFLVIGYFTTTQVITNQRLRYRSGLLMTIEGELPLANIETVFVVKPVLGRLFGYGTVVVTGKGGTTFPLRFVPEPEGFARVLRRAYEAVGSGQPVMSLCELYAEPQVPSRTKRSTEARKRPTPPAPESQQDDSKYWPKTP